jgi:hypothetical protein
VTCSTTDACRNSVLTADESKTLLAFCRAGRLYEIEGWIRDGRSTHVAESMRKTPLKVAIEIGFHSLVELLLRNEGEIAQKTTRSLLP